MQVNQQSSITSLKSAAILGATKPHGVRMRYMSGCRCLKCRMANSNYETSRAKARKSGDWNGLVDAAPARRHIAQLSKKGIGYKQVAAATSIATSVVWKIKTGKRLRIRKRNRTKILAVNAACRGDRALIGAGQTWRYLNLLIKEEGYTKNSIANLLGAQSRALQINTDRVTVKTEARVLALYRKLTT